MVGLKENPSFGNTEGGIWDKTFAAILKMGLCCQASECLASNRFKTAAEGFNFFV